jgi:hypothetical protein
MSWGDSHFLEDKGLRVARLIALAFSLTLYQSSVSLTRWGLNEAAGAALKLLQQWECQRHPRRWSARLEGIDQCSLINDDGDQHDRDTSKGR